MSEEERKSEIQKPRICKLAVLGITCGTLSLVSPVVGLISVLLIGLPYLLTDKPVNPSVDSWSKCVAMVIVFSFMLFAPLLFGMASVISCCASLIAIKRSKGKLCGKWLVYLWMFAYIAIIAFFAMWVGFAVILGIR